MKTKLTDSVSMTELLTMREQGLTNQQIAARLDVSYMTIRRLLGPQPAGLRAARGSKNAPEPLTAAEPVETPHESFAERCERVLAMAEQAEAAEAAPVVEQEPQQPLTGEKSQETSEEGAPASTPCEEPEKELSPVHELLTVFGRKTVRNYLRVALYVSGNVYAPMLSHEDMLSALKSLNGEVSTDD